MTAVTTSVLSRAKTMRDQGYSNRAIEKELGLYNGCIRYYLGKSTDPRGRKPHDDEFLEIHAAWAEGISVEELAHIHQRSVHNIYRHMYEIERDKKRDVAPRPVIRR